jgi:hypothetical protein
MTTAAGECGRRRARDESGATTTAAGEGGRRRARDESGATTTAAGEGALNGQGTKQVNLSTCGGTGLPPKKVKNKSIGNGFIFSLKINPSERIYFWTQKVKFVFDR